MSSVVTSPVALARPTPEGIVLTPGMHLAIAMIPVGGATKRHPALYIVPGKNGAPATALLSNGRRLATAFPFRLPSAPGPGGTQALAVNTTNGGVVYNIAYGLITVADGDAVTDTNSA